MSVLVIAEIGSVHDGSFGNALNLIDAAAECGANAVKLQAHIAEAETLRDAPSPPYFKSESRFDYFMRTAFTPQQWRSLSARCSERGVIFLASPFSEESVRLLEDVGMTQYKIPSGEVTNLPMLATIAALGKPVILSSGMSSWKELDAAVALIRKYHNNLSVLQCTSEYPCAYENVGLNVMTEMRERYNAPVGLSDHTLTPYASLAATALGASIIEKHFTFSRRMYGSDARHSLEPSEFADLVRGIRAIEKIKASPVDKNAVERFKVMKETFEKSVAALVDIGPGVEIAPSMLGIRKPGTGIPAARIVEVVGKRALRRIKADTIIVDEDIDWTEEGKA